MLLGEIPAQNAFRRGVHNSCGEQGLNRLGQKFYGQLSVLN